MRCRSVRSALALLDHMSGIVRVSRFRVSRLRVSRFRVSGFFRVGEGQGSYNLYAEADSLEAESITCTLPNLLHRWPITSR